MSDKKNNTGILIAIVAAIVVALGAGAFFMNKDESANTTAEATQSEQTQSVAEAEEVNDPNNPVVARVDGKAIRRADVLAFLQLQSFNPGQNIDRVFPLALEEVIKGEVLFAKADEANLESDPEVQQRFKTLKKNVIRETFVMREVDSKITDARIQKAYKEYIKELPDRPERRARHILLKTEEDAKAAIAKIKDGAKFEEVAREMSIGPTGPAGGDLGWFSKDKMVPEFGEAAFAMKKGEVSKEPVKSQFGYHVIKVEDTRTKPDLDDALKQQIVIQERRTILNDLIDGWKKDVEIVRVSEAEDSVEPAAGETKAEDTKPAEAPKEETATEPKEAETAE